MCLLSASLPFKTARRKLMKFTRFSHILSHYIQKNDIRAIGHKTDISTQEYKIYPGVQKFLFELWV